MSNITTTYSKAALIVCDIKKNPSFSQLLNVYCHTYGAEYREKAYILRKVNYYKFAEYMQQQKGIINFTAWYSINIAKPAFNEAIESYINYKEGRAGVYVSDKSPNQLDRLLYQAIKQTETMKQILAA